MPFLHIETQTDALHSPCTPTGDATTDCGPFQKCYEYDDYYLDSPHKNETLHDLMTDSGGICDCYNFWGYGYYPNCESTSSASVSIFLFTCVFPYVILALGFLFALKTILDLRRLGKFEMNVVGRGLFLNCLAAFFGTFWCVSSGISVYAPLVDKNQYSVYLLFNLGMGMYTAIFVPAFLVLPICWLENVLLSKKMKKASNFKKSQNVLRIASVVVSVTIVSLQAVRLYRLSNMLVCAFLVASVGAYYYCSKQILEYAGDLMPKGQKMAMTKTKYEVTVVAVIYLLCAGGYSLTTKQRSWGSFRPPPIFIGLDMISVGFIHLFLVRYLRYQCRKSLSPSVLLREQQFWSYLDMKTEKQKEKRMTMAPGGIKSGTARSFMSAGPSTTEAAAAEPSSVEIGLATGESWRKQGGGGTPTANPLYAVEKKKFQANQKSGRAKGQSNATRADTEGAAI